MSQPRTDVLSRLPHELKLLICSYLSIKQIGILLRVNKAWKAATLDTEAFWRLRYLESAFDFKRTVLSQTLNRCYQCLKAKPTHPSFVPNQRLCEACFVRLHKITVSDVKRFFRLQFATV